MMVTEVIYSYKYNLLHEQFSVLAAKSKRNVPKENHMLNENFITTQIKRGNRNLLIANLCLALISYFIGSKVLPFPFSIGPNLILLYALWNLIKGALALSNIKHSPTIKKIALYGNTETLTSEIENELKADCPKYDVATLTKSWYLHPTFFGLDVIKLDHVAWAYEKVKKITKAGATGQTDYSVIMKTLQGEDYDASMRGDKTADFLKRLSDSSPATFIGYSAELNQMWNKDRDAFLRQVEARRREKL